MNSSTGIIQGFWPWRHVFEKLSPRTLTWETTEYSSILLFSPRDFLKNILVDFVTASALTKLPMKT